MTTAYHYVDLGKLPTETRTLVRQDAFNGGPQTGVVVVESRIKGPVSKPIFGIYKGDALKKWEKFRKDNKLEDIILDEEALKALAESTKAEVEAAADAAKAKEDADLAAIVKDPDAK